jgi:type VI secretion system secreted protein Hcp
MKTKIIHRRLCALLCVFLMSGIDAVAALNAYFKADTITGDSTRANLESFTEINGYNHEVSAPFDPQTGLATGKRQHRPFKIVKEISRSSVDFHNAWVQGQTLKSAELRLYRQSQTGQEVNYYTYRFVGIRIVSIRDWMANNNDSNVLSLPYMQEISFTYDTIEWTFVQGGVTATDHWSTRE